MEIRKINYPVRCDMGLCRKQAVFSIGGKNTLLRRQLNLCEDCIAELYKELGRLITPKSPKNMITKGRDRELL